MTILPRFSQPLVLWLLLLVPALLWLWRRRRGSLLFSNVGLFAGLRSGRSRWAQLGSWMLRGLGLSLLVIALAGPRWPDSSARLSTEGIALAMVVDVSGSMVTSDDFSWDNQMISRLEGVKKLFRLFVEGGKTPDGDILPGRPQDLVSLVTYATVPETSCPLTLDHTALLKILDGLKPRPPGQESTNAGDALAWALVSLKKVPVRRKVIVFLTDGENNVEEKLRPQRAAEISANLGIPIYAINALPDTSTYDEAVKARQTLKEIAEISHGRYFKATGAQALAEVYAEIDRLEPSRIESYEYASYYEGFHWFSLASLACWLGLAFLESTLWRRTP